MEAALKVTSNGQVTFQRSLGIKEGDEIVFRVEQPGPPRQDDGLLGTSRHGESPGRDAERGLGRRTPPHKDRQGGCSSLERSWTRTSWFDTDWRSARDGRSGHGLPANHVRAPAHRLGGGRDRNVPESFYEAPRCQGASA